MKIALLLMLLFSPGVVSVSVSDSLTQVPYMVYPHECLTAVHIQQSTKLMIPLKADGTQDKPNAKLLGILVDFDPNCTAAVIQVQPHKIQEAKNAR